MLYWLMWFEHVRREWSRCTYFVALLILGSARNFCIIPWFTAQWFSHENVLPIITLQNVALAKGLGSILQGSKKIYYGLKRSQT